MSNLRRVKFRVSGLHFVEHFQFCKFLFIWFSFGCSIYIFFFWPILSLVGPLDWTSFLPSISHHGSFLIPHNVWYGEIMEFFLDQCWMCYSCLDQFHHLLFLHLLTPNVHECNKRIMRWEGKLFDFLCNPLCCHSGWYFSMRVRKKNALIFFDKEDFVSLENVGMQDICLTEI